MNPRPEIFNLGFYMRILNFKIGRVVSFRRDTKRYSPDKFNREGPDTLLRRSCKIDALVEYAGKSSTGR